MYFFGIYKYVVCFDEATMTLMMSAQSPINSMNWISRMTSFGSTLNTPTGNAILRGTSTNLVAHEI